MGDKYRFWGRFGLGCLIAGFIGRLAGVSESSSRMGQYYWLLFKKWPDAFRQAVTPWRFWGWLIPLVVLWVVPAQYRPFLSLEIPDWLVPAILLVAALYVLLKINYEEASKPRQELKDLKEQLGSAQSEERQKTARLVATLRELQKAGIDLRKEIVQTFRPDQHKQLMKNWQKQVLGVIEFEAPRYQNELLLAPESRIPMRNATESDYAIRDMDEWLRKLQRVVEDLEKSSR